MFVQHKTWATGKGGAGRIYGHSPALDSNSQADGSPARGARTGSIQPLVQKLSHKGTRQRRQGWLPGRRSKSPSLWPRAPACPLSPHPGLSRPPWSPCIPAGGQNPPSRAPPPPARCRASRPPTPRSASPFQVGPPRTNVREEGREQTRTLDGHVTCQAYGSEPCPLENEVCPSRLCSSKPPAALVPHHPDTRSP